MFPHLGSLTNTVKFIHANEATPGLSQTLVDVLTASLEQIGYDHGHADLEVIEGEVLKGVIPVPAMVIKVTIPSGQSVCWAVLMNEHRKFYEIVRADGSNFPHTPRH
jgi:hypothetical protein